MQQNYDIIIIGGGLTGTALICALPNLKIAVLEQHLPNFIADQSIHDTRPLTLTYSSVQALQQMGLWPTLAEHACPINKVHVSEKGRFGNTTFDAKEQNVPALGYVVPFNLLRKTLYQHASSKPQVNFIASNKINRIENNTVNFNHANGNQTLSAELIVAADGTHSTARELLNIRVRKEDQQQFAQTALIELSRTHEHIAYERFSHLGTLALMPLFNNKQARLVWTLSSKMHEAAKLWGQKDWLKLINDHFATRIGPAIKITPNQVFPLQTMVAQQVTANNTVIIGNAAHTIYPIAAQGFNLGLQDVMVLAEILQLAQAEKLNLGSLQVLNQYRDAIIPIQKRITTLTQGISDIFELQLPFITHARGLSLFALNVLKPLKSRFAKRMMGA